MASVAVCVATHNNASCIEQTAAAIAAASANLDTELIFVENGSSDGTLAILNQLPDAKVIALKENIGFAAGYNLAMQHASSDYILLLNADAAPDPRAICRMASALDADPALAAVGPCIVDEANRLQWSIVPEPTLLRALGQSFIRHILPKTTRRLRESVRQRPAYTPAPTSTRVRMVDGVCVLLRASALREVGAFDEQFFFDYETVELGLRLKNAGHGVALQQDAVVLHIAGGGHSRKSEPDAVAWSTESGIRLHARRGRTRFSLYLGGYRSYCRGASRLRAGTECCQPVASSNGSALSIDSDGCLVAAKLR